eukprot:GHVL01002670.1.p1 GENE.GHVL01002670.1~~GHVL01002670.1.p1  ORF type:complete len:1608 (-),score=344.98 GHVL01002670.1:415-4638(-)
MIQPGIDPRGCMKWIEGACQRFGIEAVKNWMSNFLRCQRLVGEANEISMQTRPKDLIIFSVEISDDVTGSLDPNNRYIKNNERLPLLILRLWGATFAKSGRGTATKMELFTLTPLTVWSQAKFETRLDIMRSIYQEWDENNRPPLRFLVFSDVSLLNFQGKSFPEVPSLQCMYRESDLMLLNSKDSDEFLVPFDPWGEIEMVDARHLIDAMANTSKRYMRSISSSSSDSTAVSSTGSAADEVQRTKNNSEDKEPRHLLPSGMTFCEDTESATETALKMAQKQKEIHEREVNKLIETIRFHEDNDRKNMEELDYLREELNKAKNERLMSSDNDEKLIKAQRKNEEQQQDLTAADLKLKNILQESHDEIEDLEKQLAVVPKLKSQLQTALLDLEDEQIKVKNSLAHLAVLTEQNNELKDENERIKEMQKRRICENEEKLRSLQRKFDEQDAHANHAHQDAQIVLTRARDQIRSEKSTVDDLQAKLDETEEYIEEMKNKSQCTIEKYKDEIESLNRKILSMQRDNKEKLETEENMKNKLQHSLERACEQIDDLKSENQCLITKKEDLQRHNSTLQSNLTRSKETNDKVSAELISTEEDLRKEHCMLQKLQEEMATLCALKLKMESAKQDSSLREEELLDELQQLCNERNQERAEASEAKDRIQKALDNADLKLKSQEFDIEQLEHQASKVPALENSLKAANHTKNEALREIDQLNTERNSLKIEIVEVKSLMEEVQKEEKIRRQHLSDEVQSLQDEIQDLNNRLDILKSERDAAIEREDNSQAALKDCEICRVNDREAVEREISYLEDEIAEIKTDAQISEERLQLEMKARVEQVGSLEKELEDEIKHHETLVDNNENMKTEISAAKKESAELRHQLNIGRLDMDQSNSRLCALLEEKKSEIREIERELIQSQLDEAEISQELNEVIEENYKCQESLKRNIEQLKAEVASSAKERETVMEDNHAKILECQRRMQEAQETIESLTRDLVLAERSTEEYKLQLKRETERGAVLVDELEFESSSHKKKVAEMKSVLSKTCDELNSCRSLIKKLEAQLNVMKDLEIQLTIANDSLEEAERQSCAAKRQIKQLSNEAGEYKERIAKMEEEKYSSREQYLRSIGDIKNEHERLADEMGQKITVLKFEQRRDRQQADNTASELRAQINKAENDIAKEKMNNEQLTQNISAISDRCAKNQKEWKDAIDAARQYQRRNEKLEMENCKLVEIQNGILREKQTVEESVENLEKALERAYMDVTAQRLCHKHLQDQVAPLNYLDAAHEAATLAKQKAEMKAQIAMKEMHNIALLDDEKDKKSSKNQLDFIHGRLESELKQSTKEISNLENKISTMREQHTRQREVEIERTTRLQTSLEAANLYAVSCEILFIPRIHCRTIKYAPLSKNNWQLFSVLKTKLKK